METILSDIARNRLEKDFNEVLRKYGLVVSNLRFDDENGFSVVVEMVSDEGVLMFCAS